MQIGKRRIDITPLLILCTLGIDIFGFVNVSSPFGSNFPSCLFQEIFGLGNPSASHSKTAVLPA
jgi:hypothetical protein